MSRAAQQLSHPSHGASVPRRPRPALASSHAFGAPSPARALQAELEGRLSDEPRAWSPRRTLGFTLLVCGSFWGAVIAAGVRAWH